MTRLAIVCTHPIQYYAPVFAGLARREELDVRVFYGWQGTANTVDPGFGRRVTWDVPLLDGYDHEFVDNVADDPGSHHFCGIDCPSMIEKIEDWNAEQVLVYGWAYRTHLAVLRHFHGRIPVCFRGDSNLLDERPGLKTIARRLLLRWVYRHVDTAFCVGTNNRKYLRKHGLVDSQIVHAPHAIDNCRFETAAVGSGQELRQRLGIPDTSVVFVFSGKLESKKAPDVILDAFRSLKNTTAHLVIAGSGPLESQLKEAAGPRTHFIGFQNQSEMPSVYAAADLVLLPSRGPGETWGLALNEAMACGRAVLASDRVGAAVDLIRPGTNGWIVAAGSTDSLREALEEAAAAGRTQLGQFGQESARIISDWTIDRQVNAIATALVPAEKQQRPFIRKAS